LQQKGVKIIAQIWGNKPEKFAEAVRHISESYAFDGIDINMGCPVKNVVAHGSCSALIDQEPLANDIIAAARASTALPLSVKTRLGLKRVDTERWISFLLKQPLDAIILHGRIQKQMSEGLADWEEIAKAVQLRDQLASGIKIIGNGDIDSLIEAHEKSGKYGVDGTMIGRGIFKNPWLFQSALKDITVEERLETLKLHLELFKKCWSDTRYFPILRRFFKIYISDFQGAADFRHQMMQVNNFEESTRTIEQWSRQLLTHSY